MMFYCSVDLMSMIVKILTRDVLGYRNITFMYAAMSAVRTFVSKLVPVCRYGAWEHDWEPTRSMGGPGNITRGLSAAGEAENETGTRHE